MELNEILALRRQLEARRREFKRADEAAIMAALSAPDPVLALHNLALADVERPILDLALSKLQTLEREARECLRYAEMQKARRPFVSGR